MRYIVEPTIFLESDLRNKAKAIFAECLLTPTEN